MDSRPDSYSKASGYRAVRSSSRAACSISSDAFSRLLPSLSFFASLRNSWIFDLTCSNEGGLSMDQGPGREEHTACTWTLQEGMRRKSQGVASFTYGTNRGCAVKSSGASISSLSTSDGSKMYSSPHPSHLTRIGSMTGRASKASVSASGIL